ncbi:MAG: hypothetical protein U0L20_06420 [Ruminococcus sp.]|nr:hypothetical protein [Ruminococcus sp.]
MTNNIKEINLNGYDTCFVEEQDDRGSFLLIAIPQNADNDISDICGKFVNGHLITEVGYCKVDGNRFIKAYY